MTTSHDHTLDAVLADARPDAPVGLAFARARVASALFGATANLGRFRVLERIGSGGMGVVYAAYDPELDRGVALKMVSVPAGGREVALAEAKALARLSHPNVVPVFDVGLVEDHVYIVMELVRGPTLRDWVKHKHLRDILDIYHQAGHALAAAHASGLVHRDFKPDNAIVGADGRVRVVDFGLACEAARDTEPERTGGTPGFMAPEQAGGVVTPAADQYSFCVSLAEALGSAPLPRWIDAVVQRGRAGDPAQRFASMSELLRALARDPARIWRRRAIAGGLVAVAVAVAVAAFFAGRTRSADDPEVCAGGAREIAATWSPAARDAQLARVAGVSAYGRELAPHLARELERFSTRWVASYHDACLAKRGGVLTDAMLDRRMMCLQRDRDAFATVAEIVSTADANALPDAARGVAVLPAPEACADLVAIANDVPLPPPGLAPRLAPLRTELERARVQLAAGRGRTARTIAHAAAGELRAIGYQPLVAQALLVEGQAMMRSDGAGAIATLREATTAAFASGADAVAIEAWARRAWIEGMDDGPDALAGLDVVEPLAKRSHSAVFARALLLNNVGSVELERGHRPEARAWFGRAFEVAREVTGPGAVELVGIRRNLALVSDDPEQREKLYGDVHAELARLLGPTHPDTLTSAYLHAANGVRRMRDAAAILAGTCERFEEHESLATLIPSCLAELGDLRDELGDVAGAIAAFDHALVRDGANQPEVPELAGYARLWQGDAAGAVRAFEAALARSPLRANQPFYQNYAYGKLRLGQARALRAAGKRDEARRALEQSLDVLHEVDERSTMTLQRRLARVRAELAAVLAAMNGRPAKVHELAARALAWYRQSGGTPAQIAELERLTGSP